MGNESPTKLAFADTTRLVQSEWVLGDFRRVSRRFLRHSRGRGLVAGVLARVVHGRRVGEGTAFAQWGGVRVFLDAGAGGGGGPPSSALRTGPSRASGQAQGERRGFEARLRSGLVGACRRPAHLWIPAFAGTTVGGGGGNGPRLVVGRPALCPFILRFPSARTGTPRPSGFPPARERRLGGYTTGLTPPSMLMAVPVMKLARSEARKVMRLAASSDSPTRPRGTFLPISA